MNRKIYRYFLAASLSIFGLFVLVNILIYTGNLYVGISAYSHYRLNEVETKLVEDWISRFHKNVENGNFEEIRKELVKNSQGIKTQDAQLENAKFAFDKFGTISSIKFFRCMPPEPASVFYGDNIEGSVYGLFYHSNAERGRLSEHFELVINEKNEVSLLRYSGDEMKEWEVRAYNNDHWLERKLPTEIRIPFGKRFIEIRY